MSSSFEVAAWYDLGVRNLGLQRDPTDNDSCLELNDLKLGNEDLDE